MMPFSPPLRWVDLEAGFGLAITFDLPDFGSQPAHVRGAATRWAMATTPTSRATLFNPGPIDLVGMVVSLSYVSALGPDQLAVARQLQHRRPAGTGPQLAAHDLSSIECMVLSRSGFHCRSLQSAEL